MWVIRFELFCVVIGCIVIMLMFGFCLDCFGGFVVLLLCDYEFAGFVDATVDVCFRLLLTCVLV